MLSVESLKVGTMPPLSFAVAGGECLAIEGPSGIGKTRLMRAIADLDPAPGQIFLDGAERGEGAGPAWRRHVRYCAAEPAWWTDTARPAFGALAAKSGATAAQDKRAQRLIAMLGLPPELLDRPISLLSTGERLRLALARALIDEPKVVLLDEPTASLDKSSAALVEELIKFLLLSRRTVLLVSHDTRQIERLAHTRLQLSDPATVRSGATS